MCVSFTSIMCPHTLTVYAVIKLLKLLSDSGKFAEDMALVVVQIDSIEGTSGKNQFLTLNLSEFEGSFVEKDFKCKHGHFNKGIPLKCGETNYKFKICCYKYKKT